MTEIMTKMVIKYYYTMFKDRKNIGITSTTGISSLLIGGCTLHSYLGIGLGKGDQELLFKKIKGNKKIIINNKKLIDCKNNIVNEETNEYAVGDKIKYKLFLIFPYHNFS